MLPTLFPLKPPFSKGFPWNFPGPQKHNTSPSRMKMKKAREADLAALVDGWMGGCRMQFGRSVNTMTPTLW